MLIYVKAEYSNEKTTKHMIGNLNTTNFIFTSNKNDSYKINKNFDKYQYKGRIIFVNEDEKNSQEWIFTLLPTQKMTEALGITDKEDSEESIYENESESESESENESENENECKNNKEILCDDDEEEISEEEYSEYSDED